jgi:hypothetical protein
MGLRSFLLVLASLLVTNCFSQTTPKPGVIDATTFDFANKRLNLSGTWIWYDGKLLLPGELKDADGVPTEVPGTWNERRANGNGQGYATYALNVIVPHVSEQLALDIPDIYSSYILYANGVEVTRNGTPGKTGETTTPQWRPHVAPLNITDDTLRLVLQIANFNHNKGGMKEAIRLGSASALAQKEFLSMSGKAMAVGLLFALAIVFLGVYFRHGRKIIVIYFSLLCVTWAIRSLFSNDYMITKIYPDFNWNTMVRIEYITLYLTMVWAILFLCRLFKNERNQVVKYLLVVFNCGFVVYTLLTPPVEFTQLLTLYLVTAGVLLVYGAGVVLVALINERKGATWLTISVMLGLVIFSYDIFTYEGWFTYNSLVFSAGYLVIFLMMGAALLLHLEIIKGARTQTTMLTYKDLYGEETES